MNYVSPFYRFGENRIDITTHKSSSVILCLSVVMETCVNFVATLWFLQAYQLWRIRVSEPLSSNGRLCSASLTAHFRRSGVMSQYLLHFQGRRWRRHVSPKHQLSFNGLRGFVS
jgi:hypothetical protein